MRLAMPDDEREVLSMELQFLVDQLARLEDQMKLVDSRLEELVASHELGGKLIEMAGIGTYSAAVELSAVLPLARCAREAQVATYCGVTPLSRQSGSSDRTRLGRGSNKLVLSSRFMSAMASIRVSAIDRAYYDKKRRDYEGHPAAHKKAVLALARQRSKVIYRLLTTSERYDLNKLVASKLQRQAA